MTETIIPIERPVPTFVCGIDPGPKPGFVVLGFWHQRLAGFRCVDFGPEDIVAWIEENAEISYWAGFRCVDFGSEDIVAWIEENAEISYWAVERYQQRPTRTKNAAAQDMTLVQAAACRAAAQARPQTRVVQFLPPGTVKPWATDERLAEFGIQITNRHHRDAARHALYLAAKMGFVKWTA